MNILYTTTEIQSVFCSETGFSHQFLLTLKMYYQLKSNDKVYIELYLILLIFLNTYHLFEVEGFSNRRESLTSDDITEQNPGI